MRIIIYMYFVDFAHTPNAIEQVLKTLRGEFPASRIIHVFGATGMRDRDKRPIMGEISGTMADISCLDHGRYLWRRSIENCFID